MKTDKVTIASFVLILVTLACGLGGPSMDSPDSESRETIPLYSNLEEISLDEADKQALVTDVLGYQYLLYAYTTNLSWSEDAGSDVIDQLDTKLPDEKWRLETDWLDYTGTNALLISEWRKGDLGLVVAVFDNLSSEDLNTLNKEYGISDLTPGSTLILSHATDYTQPLPNTTATAQVESQISTATAEMASYSGTATAEIANFSRTATAEAITNSIQSTQAAQATNEANIALQAELEKLSQDFNSDQLSDKWTVYRPDPTRWDLTSESGFLHIVGSPQREAGILNIFGLRVTYADVDVITRIESLNMLDDGQSAWIAFTPEDYSNSDYTVALGITFDDRDGYQIYMWHCQYDNCYYPESVGLDNIKYEGEIYLRLTRIGTNYSGYYSFDGSSWIFAGEKKEFPLVTDQIMLGAGIGRDRGEEFDVYFDFINFGIPKP